MLLWQTPQECLVSHGERCAVLCIPGMLGFEQSYKNLRKDAVKVLKYFVASCICVAASNSFHKWRSKGWTFPERCPTRTGWSRS